MPTPKAINKYDDRLLRRMQAAVRETQTVQCHDSAQASRLRAQFYAMRRAARKAGLYPEWNQVTLRIIGSTLYLANARETDTLSVL